MELSILVPVISLLIAGASFYYARKKDTAADSSQITQLIVEMRGMREDITEMKADFKSLRAEMKADHDKLVAMERDFKTMWARIDELKELIRKQ